MGINYSSWNHYLWVSNDMKLPLIILFAVSDKTPPVSGAPPVPRSGIWLQDSKFLCSAIKANLGHIWGPNDMIYWNVNLFRWWKRLPKELLDVYISNNQVYKKTEELGL
jgi:hypothetical protein